ncbi:MAG: hypothetical protein, partial [Olavius algarvensis Gamma 1 endosymbiont]
ISSVSVCWKKPSRTLTRSSSTPTKAASLPVLSSP